MCKSDTNADVNYACAVATKIVDWMITASFCGLYGTSRRPHSQMVSSLLIAGVTHLFPIYHSTRIGCHYPYQRGQRSRQED